MTVLYILLIFVVVLFKTQVKSLLEAIIKLVIALSNALVTSMK